MSTTKEIPYVHNPSSTNYTNAQNAQAEKAQQTAKVSIPDGRRNSVGQELPSPVETWKPNLARNQSWNQQDQKRKIVENRLKEDVKKWEGSGGWTEAADGAGGFTEKRSE